MTPSEIAIAVIESMKPMRNYDLCSEIFKYAAIDPQGSPEKFSIDGEMNSEAVFDRMGDLEDWIKRIRTKLAAKIADESPDAPPAA